eukprot:jgi/Chlat1/3094/Chrsp21S03339
MLGVHSPAAVAVVGLHQHLRQLPRPSAIRVSLSQRTHKPITHPTAQPQPTTHSLRRRSWAIAGSSVRAMASSPSSSATGADAKAPAARPSAAEAARTLVNIQKLAVFSTHSKLFEGHPSGSVVSYATDDEGRPIFAFSSISQHWKDIVVDPRCSVTVMANGFQGMADARVTLIGSVRKVKAEEEAACKETFLTKHPDAFWVNFGDFGLWRLDQVVGAFYNGGFARFQVLSSKDYFEARPDPIAPFAAPIMGHMNADHGDSIAAYVRHYLGEEVDSARLKDIDYLGMEVMAKKDGQEWQVRVPFIRPAETRGEVKQIMVEMVREASAAVSKGEEQSK